MGAWATTDTTASTIYVSASGGDAGWSITTPTKPKKAAPKRFAGEKWLDREVDRMRVSL